MTDLSAMPPPAVPAGRIRRDWIIVGILSPLLIAIAGGVLWWNNAAFPGTHSHGGNPTVGMPGDAALPARTVEVKMVEGNGTMSFEPAMLAVTRGERIRFRITNAGLLDHEFVLATLADNLMHLEAMKKVPDMVHHDAHNITLKPDQSGEILWKFTSSGTFDFSCLIPGHREAGMHGSIVVKAPTAAVPASF